HAGAEAQAQVVRELRDGNLAIITRALAENRDFFHAADGPDLDAELSDQGMTPDQVFHLRRVEVDAPHREHVVDAAADAADDLCEGITASASCSRYLNPVTGPIADQRRSPAAEVGRD